MCMYVCGEVRYSFYFKSFTTSANILKRATLHSSPPLLSPPNQRGLQQLEKKAVRKAASQKRDKWWEGSLLWVSWTELHALAVCWSYNRRQSPFPVCVFCLPSRITAGAGTGLKKTSGCINKEEDEPKERNRK